MNHAGGDNKGQDTSERMFSAYGNYRDKVPVDEHKPRRNTPWWVSARFS